MKLRIAFTAAAFVGFAGLALAAPASADTPCDDGSHGPCYQTNGPFWLDTPVNYALFGPKTVNNWAHLPGDTVAGYQQAIIDTIRNYTGINITQNQRAATTRTSGLTGATTGTGTAGPPSTGTGTGTGQAGS